MTASPARRRSSPQASAGAVAAPSPVPPVGTAELPAPAGVQYGALLVFPRPAADPGRLGLPIDSFQAHVLEQLERRVGRDAYRGWGREARGSASDAPEPDFFVDVGERRFRGETLLQAAAAAARACR